MDQMISGGLDFLWVTLSQKLGGSNSAPHPLHRSQTGRSLGNVFPGFYEICKSKIDFLHDHPANLHKLQAPQNLDLS